VEEAPKVPERVEEAEVPKGIVPEEKQSREEIVEIFKKIREKMK
jgi:hypothetical protein